MIVDKAITDCIVEKLRKHDEIEKAVLFGSRARGSCTEKSDYDIAIFGRLNSESTAELRHYCAEELPTLHKIDLVFVTERTSAELLKNINNEGIVLYEKNRQ